MMDSCQKERRLDHEYNGVDRISELPDAVLCKILNLLPTKNVVATSVLSTRWNSLSPFSFPPVILDLNDSFILYPKRNRRKRYQRFMDFVDKLFDETLFDVSNVEVMMLSLSDDYDYGTDKIISWIDDALSLNVREITLDVVLENECESLFWCLNGCITLTRLELGKEFSVCVPCDFALPNLKSLVLFALALYDDINEMIAGCPVLEELCLSYCDSKDCGVIRIQSHLLKKLTVEACWDESDCGLIIDAPNLETLKYVDTAADSFSVSKFRSLRMAHISLGRHIRTGEEFVGVYEHESGVEEEIYFDEFNDEVKYLWFDATAKLVTACSNTSQLYLERGSVNALLESSMELPEFQELSVITICRLWGSKGWELLAHLLYKSPNIEKLTIKEGLHGKSYSSFESLLMRPPDCLELHLKEIEFWLSEEEEDEIKLVEYFLKHGKVVQKLTLSCLPFKKASSLSRLNMFTGHSKIDFQPRYKLK